MASQNILLPYNFTDYDQKALNFVIRTFAHLENVDVTLFHAYTPVPEVEMRESQVMEKLRDSLSYLSQRIKEQEAGLQVAKHNLVENGFSEDRIRYVFKARNKDVASEIVNFAQDGNFSLIIINRKPGKVTRFFTGGVLNKVASALKNTTICLVT